ncbi:MAG: NUDIX domain-containing protein [Xanthomonadaceae bacterium]|nr:NUDIX domain-containing protein [Rhodospirillaceae bacterium]NIA18010.1 NUDIX domain-containing protein [Xanthomonadaceae bacterium]
MSNNNIIFENIIKKFSEKLPKFSDGRIDYSNSDKAPVLVCFKYQNDILLLKRSDKVRTYQGLWNTVAGYLDEPKPVIQKAYEEVSEEISVGKKNILKTKIGDSFKFYDKDIKKIWIIFPVLIELKFKPAIKLDWEHTDYKWIKIREIKKYNVIPHLDKTLAKVL